MRKQKKKCKKGHTFYKSGDCPTCPICEKEKTRKSVFNFLGSPARSALENDGIKNLKQLSKKTEKEILSLHGMGHSSIPLLKKKLKEKGLSFRNKS
jgi:DNA-directed RNA polymerase alpha subunit